MIRLYFLSGFLGAGKTTLLLKLLEELEGRKVGAIVNEFGKIGVDGEIVNRAGLEMTELAGGQIFCSCLEADFIEAAAAFAGLDVEYLFVETSGLALPKTLESTLGSIQMLSGDAFDYRGLVCVTDAVQFFDLVDLVLAFEQQIICSNLIVLNKTDLAGDEELKRIEKEIERLAGGVPVIRTSYCDAAGRVLSELEKPKTPGMGGEMAAERETDTAAPRKLLLVPEEILDETALFRFLKAAAAHAYRIKGFVRIAAGLVHIDVTAGEVTLRSAGNRVTKDKLGINMITITGEENDKKIVELWRELAGVPFSLG